MDTNLSTDYYENIKLRKSEQIRDQLGAIPEEAKELDISVEIDRSKFLFPESEELPVRKDRTGTFKPFNYIKEKEAEEQKETQSKDVKTQKTTNDEQMAIMNTIKNRIFNNEPNVNEDPSNKE